LNDFFIAVLRKNALLPWFIFYLSKNVSSAFDGRVVENVKKESK
jgi:hypothetical protein